MTTTKKRINISVSDIVEDAIVKLAKRDNMPQATKASELLRIALEIEEDFALNKIALKRDIVKVKFVSHKKAWA